MSIVIKIENLSKQYRLGLVSTRTLSHDLNRWWQTSILGREDPYLKIGETNIREVRGESEYVWALKDINLEIEEGEVLGIIGKNGAGKSTLLKILSKVTSPTTGSIKARGRIASLLEIGTGFHSEMTGRENIYLNGAILGMTKAEISKKLDEIIDFAGVERYIDTPVKRYSSGMLVRLGFAVAAHLEPEILIVDEVLAVGDAEFQKKAIGKMQDISERQGRTVLFVSHNMGSIESLCTKSIVLKQGAVEIIGKTQEVVTHYLSSLISEKEILLMDREDRKGVGNIKFQKIIFENGINSRSYAIGNDIFIRVFAKNYFKELKRARFSISINSINLFNLISCDSNLIGRLYDIPPVEDFSFVCRLIKPPLNVGDYIVNVAIYINDIPQDWIISAARFSIITGSFDRRERINHMPVLAKFEWEVQY